MLIFKTCSQSRKSCKENLKEKLLISIPQRHKSMQRPLINVIFTLQKTLHQFKTADKKLMLELI